MGGRLPPGRSYSARKHRAHSGKVEVGTWWKIPLGAIALNKFYARMRGFPMPHSICSKLAPESVATGAAESAPSTTAAGVTSTEVLAIDRRDQELPVSIGRIEVAHGEVRSSPFLRQIQLLVALPTLPEVFSALSATQAGDVQVEARVEDTRPWQSTARSIRSRARSRSI